MGWIMDRITGLGMHFPRSKVSLSEMPISDRIDLIWPDRGVSEFAMSAKRTRLALAARCHDGCGKELSWVDRFTNWIKQ